MKLLAGSAQRYVPAVGGGVERQMGDVSTFKDWLETAKDKIEAAEAVGFTRAEAIELVKIFEIWGLNDSIGCVRF